MEWMDIWIDWMNRIDYMNGYMNLYERIDRLNGVQGICEYIHEYLNRVIWYMTIWKNRMNRLHE